MNAIFYAHSGLRYVVLLLAVVVIGYHLYGLATRRPADGFARVSGRVFVGVLDLQILLGLILMALGIYYGALIGHLVMMILAAAAAHAAVAVGKRTEDPRTYHKVVLAGVGAALVLIVLGVSAIGRSVLQSGAPSVGG